MGRIGALEIGIWIFVLVLVAAKFALIIYLVMRNRRKQEEGRQFVRRYVESLAEEKPPETAVEQGEPEP